MMWNLFIDDERNPHDATWAPWIFQIYPWTIARSQDEVFGLIMGRGCPDVISFDHDLGYNTPTGYDIAKLICEYDMDRIENFYIPENFRFFVHSKNPVGGMNIQRYLDNYLKARKGTSK